MIVHSVARQGVRAFVLVAALTAAVVAVPGIPSDSSPGQAQGTALQYKTGVSLKLVQVYVTDKAGKPAEDLTAEDFEVSDNGQVQPVIHFEKHFIGMEETPGGPAGTLSTNRKFFLIFDFAFMDPRGVIKSKDAALKFLETEIRPTDEIGLVTYSVSRGLVVHEYLTTDHARVRGIIGGFGLSYHAGRAENLTDYVYASDLTEMQAWGAGPGRPSQGSESELETQFYENQALRQTGKRLDEGRRQGYVEQAQEFFVTLGKLAKSFRYIPGFKNVIFFSGGIAKQLLFGKRGGAVVGEWQTPEELAQQLSDYDAAQSDTGLRSEFTQTLKEFRASNSPVFAIDSTRTIKDADSGTGMSGREVDGSDSLRQFASGTGGKFYANTQDSIAIAKDIQKVTGAYYVLGYTVSENWDGKFHKIKVRAKRKGLEVTAQGGYFGAKPFNDLTPFEKLLHVVDLALSDAPQLQVPFEIPVRAMPVLIKGWPHLVAFARTSLAAHGDVLGKKVEAYLMLFDEKGDVAYIKKFRLAIPERGKETFFPAFILPVKRGAYTCRIIVRNLETGRGARGAVSLDMPGVPAAGIFLDPPLLLVPDAASLDFGITPSESLAKVFAYNGDAYAPLLGDVPPGADKLHAALRLTGVSLGGSVEVTASLIDPATSAGTPVPVDIIGRSAEGATTLLFVEMATGRLGPGSYTIAVQAKDVQTGIGASSSADIRVKSPE